MPREGLPALIGRAGMRNEPVGNEGLMPEPWIANAETVCPGGAGNKSRDSQPSDGQTTGLRFSPAARANRAQELIWHDSLGFLFGYFVLHPVSMFIFHWLDSSRPWAAGMTVVQLFMQSFRLPMLPMGVAFGLVSSTIFAVMALQRLTISVQRDDLVRQLQINEGYRLQLEQQARLLKTQNKHLTRLERNTRGPLLMLPHD